MNDDQIAYLVSLLDSGIRLAWQSGCEFREILSISLRRETQEGPEGDELAGNFSNGEYAALMAVNPEDVVIFDVRPVVFDGVSL